MKLYVGPPFEKARRAVPLIDRVARKVEETMPTWIIRIDKLVEPRIQKMRPYLEPLFEQLKEVVTPYVHYGVKKVEEKKKFTNAKVSQIKGFTAKFCKFILDVKGMWISTVEQAMSQGKKFLDTRRAGTLQAVKFCIEKMIAATNRKIETLLGEQYHAQLNEQLLLWSQILMQSTLWKKIVQM